MANAFVVVVVIFDNNDEHNNDSNGWRHYHDTYNFFIWTSKYYVSFLQYLQSTFCWRITFRRKQSMVHTAYIRMMINVGPVIL